MSNRITKGKALAGGFEVDSSGAGYGFGGLVAHKASAVAFAITATSEQDSGWDTPSNALITDVYVKITTASSAAGTMSVGLITTSSGDADGFIVALGTSTTGIFRPEAVVTSATSGDTVTGCTRGALLASYSSGTTQDEFGNYTPKAFRTGSVLENNVSWTFNSTSGCAGYVIFEYTQIE
jgi:hypothetical protein